MFDLKKLLFSIMCVSLWLCLFGVPSLFSDPEFVPIDDQSVCEGDWVIIVMYADALFPEDDLEFDMEGAPEGAILENYGNCG